MEICLGLLQTCGYKISSSWISLTLLFSMLCMWTSVECWSYHFSNKTMDWQQARAWCKEHYTDMVAIQNQEEIRHLNSSLPKQRNYYWIGIRKINNVWTWVGTNKTLTAEATNWAKGEPNNGKNGRKMGENEDCVEMYIKRNEEPGKWNDERCGKMKTALCYTAACENDSCHYGECVETINSHKCVCFDGFYGEKCEHVVKCDKEEVTVPDKGSVNCTHTYGDYSYDSLCKYSCEKGYQLSMSRPLRCTASTKWSEEPPTCELVKCPELSRPARGSMNCSNPLGPSSYQSTCVFTCDEGYVQAHSPSNTLQCEASGSWNASQPSCVAVQCPTLQKLENVLVDCGDVDMKFIYGNTCSFSCALGYHLVGPSRMTCTSAAEWSERMPRCEATTCQNPEGDAHLIPKCSQSPTDLQPGSTCIFSCEAGFELQGVQTIQCFENGQWSRAIPTCKAKGCPAPKTPTNGKISCSLSPSSPVSTATPHPPGMICTFSCDEGHELEGALSMECEHPGQWNSTPPTCTVVRCPVLAAPENAHMNCSDSEPAYSSRCSFTCGQDYSLDGHELLTCDRHGNWTGPIPTCQASPSQISTIVSGVAAGGTLFSVVSLAMWILKRLKQKSTKFELKSNSDIEAPPQFYKNSTDSLI
ncbi:E-selectin [Xiphias gladius]|uniref:E-selectin n=1 Tax=Xiphias gladius TaxID=8245 RepID=UPI001A9839FD|nr:E-selectin [Xiphias gladius]